MSIFVSTGGFAKLPGNIVAERYLQKGIKTHRAIWRGALFNFSSRFIKNKK